MDLDLALRMRSEGLSIISIARALDVHPSPFTLARAGDRSPATLQRRPVLVPEPSEVLLDELNAGGIAWLRTLATRALRTWATVQELGGK